MYYFAYGSNMNHEQMLENRCPGSKFISRARLSGYRLVYDGYSGKRKGPVANILEARETDIVWGGLFYITEKNLEELNHYEDFPKSYNRDIFNVTDDDGNIFEAHIYFRKGKKEGKPSEEYRDIIRQGASDCGLPETYISSNI